MCFSNLPINRRYCDNITVISQATDILLVRHIHADDVNRPPRLSTTPNGITESIQVDC